MPRILEDSSNYVIIEKTNFSMVGAEIITEAMPVDEGCILRTIVLYKDKVFVDIKELNATVWQKHDGTYYIE